jgi:uncharacterized protein
VAAAIKVSKATPEKLKQLGSAAWPIWEKEVSVFDWYYDEPETCHILEGKVRVEPKDGGAAAEFGAGDIVEFPQGLACTWKISKAVRKHYKFG